MYQNCCKKCGSVSLHTENKGNNTGLYCDDCGAWVKWLGKDELRAFEHSKKVPNESSLAQRLRTFIGVQEMIINRELEQVQLSPEDSLQKSAYCSGIERDRNALLNILAGREWNQNE